MGKPVVFITGTSSGFGLLSTVTLARNGYHVIAAMRNLQKSKDLKELLQNEGLQDSVEMTWLDVTNHRDVKKTIDDTVQRLGHIDVLINNAGFAEGGFVEHLSVEDYYNQFETNFFGVVAVTKAALPYMRERGKGKIINVSSISGKMGFSALSAYVSSKFAIEGFSESLRLEVLPFGVYVSLVEPGSFDTKIWSNPKINQQELADSPYKEGLEAILKHIEKESKSRGNPQEVADLFLHILNEDKPKLRYPIGKGIKRIICIKNMLPWEWIEKFIFKLRK